MTISRCSTRSTQDPTMTMGHNILAEEEESAGRALDKIKNSSLNGFVSAMCETSDRRKQPRTFYAKLSNSCSLPKLENRQSNFLGRP